MSIKKAILSKLGVAVSVDRNELGEMDVLIHKAARNKIIHGYVSASCKTLNIKGGTVAVHLPDFDDAPLITPRFLFDLQEAFNAQGWTFSHIVAWGSALSMGEMLQAHEGEDEHVTGYNVTSSVAVPEHELMQHGADVPAFLRKGIAMPNPISNEGVLKFQRMDRAQRPLFADNPNVAALVEAAHRRIAGLDEMAREAAKVRFEAIASNGMQLNQSHEYIRDRLENAVNVIIGAHEQTDASAAVQH
jgi:hypothetical protein